MRTTQVPGPRGYDGGKKVMGHKRDLLCDTQGLALELVVTVANISDTHGARLVWQSLRRRWGVAKNIRRVWVDAGYKPGVRRWCQQPRQDQDGGSLLCPSAGSSSAPSPGSVPTGVWSETMKSTFTTARRWCGSLSPDYFSSALPDFQNSFLVNRR